MLGKFSHKIIGITAALLILLVLAEVAKFPKAILDLAPVQAQIRYEGCLILAMHGGFDHFGLIAYSTSFKEPYPGFKYGAREIVEGLWYYDDGYRDDSPGFRKLIDAWIEEGNKKMHQQAAHQDLTKRDNEDSHR